MKDAIEDIILSYIKYSKKIDIQAIKYIVNEPDYLISKRIKRLYDNGYIVKKNQGFLINEEKSGELIEWNKIVLLQNPGDEFCVDDRGFTRFNKNGYPALNNYNNLFQLLMLDHIMLDAYHTFVIWNGKKERRILAPSWNLKKRQKWIHKQILGKYLLPDCVHGFAPQKSIVTNAKSHINMNEIGCLDIKDFFPSINGNMVFDAFMKMGYNVNVSKLLTDVCIYDNQLPQGGLCGCLHKIPYAEF